jgi:photosystem II stability/assembly factor-like uncharacterized protein
VAIDPATPSTVYAATLPGGVFKTSNGGTNWSAVNSGVTNLNIVALAIDPLAPSSVYAGSSNNGGVFKTTNGGAGWSAVTRGCRRRASTPSRCIRR